MEKKLQSRGLSAREAAASLAKYGENRIIVKEEDGLLKDIFLQLADPLNIILILAAVISVSLKESQDALIILFVILMDTTIGLIQKSKAKKSLKALEKMSQPLCSVYRDGELKRIEAKNITIGDLVSFEAGDMIPADLILTRANSLFISEATLTGESLPVNKIASDKVEGDDELRRAYMSTLVTGGSGEGIVTCVGMETQLGKVAAASNKNGQIPLTPLQRKLSRLGQILGVFSIVICIALVIFGIIWGREIVPLLLVAISLAVAAVPEGLPAVVTICMAVGVARMARRKSIVRNLSAVETLGAVDVVCTDKTGTLTQNKMSVVNCYGRADSALLKAMVLCNSAHLEEEIGDPMELAILRFASKLGADVASIRNTYRIVDELPFDSDRKRMSVVVSFGERSEGGLCSYTKGAPEGLLEHCTYIFDKGKVIRLSKRKAAEIRADLLECSEKTLRCLAFAMKYIDETEVTSRNIEDSMIWLGFVAMEDPIRENAYGAVESFRKAGVRTIMITGDNAVTATSYGQRLGLFGNNRGGEQEDNTSISGPAIEKMDDSELREVVERTNVFARVSPAQKLRIVKALKANRHYVAMTGDGVNDAPSLKIADVGVAMGETGCEIAKQAADIILLDDNFATIEAAMVEGRGIYENIKKTVLFLLSSNLGEIVTMLVAVVVGLPAPLKSGHILWINLITDSLPAIALGMDKNDEEYLCSKPPRKADEGILSGGGLSFILIYGVVIGMVSLLAYALPVIPYIISYNYEDFSKLFSGDLLLRCQTYSFTVLGVTQLFHAFISKNIEGSIFNRSIFDNPLLVISFVCGLGMQIILTKCSFFINIFSVTHLSLAEWLVLVVLSALPLLFHEVRVFFSKKLC